MVSPSNLGFCMPAEWQPHSATWLSWPKNPLTFPKKMIGAVEETYCRMIEALSEGETVKMLVDSEAEERRVGGKLDAAGVQPGNVKFYRIRTSDVWIRDYGPTFLLDHKGKAKAAVRWIFNAWGNKYDDLLQDNAAGDAVVAAAEREGKLEVFRPGVVMEGGSIDANGEGALLTTEQCLLNRNRNPSLDRGQIEGFLKGNLGVSRVIWLKEGIEGDDTDGHVDDFARFAGKNTVVCAREKGKSRNALALEENRRILLDAGLEVVGLPMPTQIIDSEEGRPLPASYANFYIGNRAVLMPAFGGAKDKEAAETLQTVFSGREIIPVPCRELVYGYGGLHCVTQQEPK